VLCCAVPIVLVPGCTWRWTVCRWYKEFSQHRAYIMLLITVSYRRCGRNLRAKLDTVINSLSANHAGLKTLRTELQTGGWDDDWLAASDISVCRQRQRDDQHSAETGADPQTRTRRRLCHQSTSSTVLYFSSDVRYLHANKQEIQRKGRTAALISGADIAMSAMHSSHNRTCWIFTGTKIGQNVINCNKLS